MDTFVETTRRGWLSRIKGAVAGVLIGGVLFVASFPILWMNESNSVDNIRTIEEARKSTVTVESATPSPQTEGKLVHVKGSLATEDTLRDDAFGVALKTIRLERSAEMYQWQEKKSSETKQKLGGGEETVTTYRYDMTWHEGRIDSSNFRKAGHDNPQPAVESMRVQAPNVALGGFALQEDLIGQYHQETPVPLRLEDIPADSRARYKAMADGGVYLGADPAKPVLGDQRIHLQEHRPGPASVIARQEGNRLVGQDSASGKTIAWLYPGHHSIAEICGFKARENAFLTWILRGVGFLCMWIGCGLFLRPLRVLGDVVPFIGSLIGGGIFVMTLLLSLALSATTIAVAWVAVRPLVGIPALIAIAALAYKLRSGRKQAPAAAYAGAAYPPPPPPPPPAT